MVIFLGGRGRCPEGKCLAFGNVVGDQCIPRRLLKLGRKDAWSIRCKLTSRADDVRIKRSYTMSCRLGARVYVAAAVSSHCSPHTSMMLPISSLSQLNPNSLYYLHSPVRVWNKISQTLIHERTNSVQKFAQRWTMASTASTTRPHRMHSTRMWPIATNGLAYVVCLLTGASFRGCWKCVWTPQRLGNEFFAQLQKLKTANQL